MDPSGQGLQCGLHWGCIEMIALAGACRQVVLGAAVLAAVAQGLPCSCISVGVALQGAVRFGAIELGSPTGLGLRSGLSCACIPRSGLHWGSGSPLVYLPN